MFWFGGYCDNMGFNWKQGELIVDQLLSSLISLETYSAPLLFIFVTMTVGFLWSENRRDQLLSAIDHCTFENVRAGNTTDLYFNADRFLGDPKHARMAANWIKDELYRTQSEGISINRLAFIEKMEGPVGALTMKDLSSWITGIPSVTIRLSNDVPDSRLAVAGDPYSDDDVNILKANENVAIITDTLTSGKTIFDAISVLDDCGVKVIHALALFDRKRTETRKKFSERGIKLSVFMVPPVKSKAAKADNEPKEVLMAS